MHSHKKRKQFKVSISFTDSAQRSAAFVCYKPISPLDVTYFPMFAQSLFSDKRLNFQRSRNFSFALKASTSNGEFS